MTPFSVADLVRGARGALVGGRLDGVLTGVSIDTRTAAPGDAFFAIRGHRQDGHAFVGRARAAGVGALVVRHLPADLVVPGDLPVVVVGDTTLALQRLGAFHRRRHPIPLVGITGSNGKTTTKELTAVVLSARRTVLKAAGSQNNQWGVPLTLLGIEPRHEVAVLEFGMNAFGEIAAHARLAQPTIGVVTSIHPAHLEGVASIEGVQKAKGELVEAIPADGLVILNADDPLVAALADRAQARVVTYGRAAGADVRLDDVRSTATDVRFTLSAAGATAPVRVPLPGRHSAWNAAAAVAVGLALGIPLPDAAAALGQASGVKGRLVWREAGGVRILDDTYNANPTSLRAALDVLRAAIAQTTGDGGGGRSGGTTRLWAVLGDMLELGMASDAAHREAGAWAAALPLEGLVTVGEGMRLAAEVARDAGGLDVASFDTPEAAALHVAGRVAPGDRVLVKGSRGMRMERAVDTLLTALAGPRRPPC
jgi:UDP-N-acetylmuramoyl-tripeptide--D-alanyl-D-alanine ligase